MFKGIPWLGRPATLVLCSYGPRNGWVGRRSGFLLGKRLFSGANLQLLGGGFQYFQHFQPYLGKMNPF